MQEWVRCTLSKSFQAISIASTSLAVGIYCPHTRLPQDFSSESGHAQQSGEVEYDYLDVTGSRTDDSGFEEPNQWKQHMSNPPPDQSKPIYGCVF